MSFTALENERIEKASQKMAVMFLSHDDRQTLAATGNSARRSKGETQRRCRHAYQASQHYLRAVHAGVINERMNADEAEQAIRTSIGPITWWLLSAVFRALLSQLIQWAIYRPTTVTTLLADEGD